MQNVRAREMERSFLPVYALCLEMKRERLVPSPIAVSLCFSNDRRICQLFCKEGIDYANLLRDSAESLVSESMEYVNVKEGNHTSNINNHY